MTEIEKSKTTEMFLRLIAQHLSSRQDCRGIEYTVTIGNEYWDDIVLMDPPKHVYPDKHRRSSADLRPVTEHVLKYHMPELYLPTEDSCNLFIDKDKIVPGVYMYQLSVDKKKRRWIKVESL